MRQSILPRIHVSTTCFRGQHPVISQAPPVPQPGAFCLERYCTDSSPANAHRMMEKGRSAMDRPFLCSGLPHSPFSPPFGEKEGPDRPQVVQCHQEEAIPSALPGIHHFPPLHPKPSGTGSRESARCYA